MEKGSRARRRLLTGGKSSGAFYAPPILEDVPEACSLAREEVFGPVAVLTRFGSLDEAISIANGLTPVCKPACLRATSTRPSAP